METQEYTRNKTVSYDPVPSPIPPCCANVTNYMAMLGVRAETGERGYILHSPSCDCQDRWISHDWGKGHAEFVTLKKA